MSKLTFAEVKACPIELATALLVSINTAKDLGWYLSQDPVYGRMWAGSNSDYEVVLTGTSIEGLLGAIADYENERQQDAQLDPIKTPRTYRLNELPARFGRGR